jgi:hypothetical protein
MPQFQSLAQLLHDFSNQPLSPLAFHQFERDLGDATRSLARAALETAVNALEPADPAQAPPGLRVEGLRYRYRGKTPATIDSLFGPLLLRRGLYESRDGGPCLFPLQHLLGIVAGRVTPALASRVGQSVASDTQREALARLREDHDVRWSATTLRKVAAAVAEAVEPHREEAQAAQVVRWLRQAWRTKGKLPPVLALGRDGVTLNKGGEEYEVAGVGTLSVYDRQGKRVGTVYLAFMPQKEQVELSRQLTSLVKEVLRRTQGRRPRLAYVSDAGATESGYYESVLRGMKDPVTGEALGWVRVVDYYHAAQYVGKLADALFGKGAGQGWARRMRQVLKEAKGVGRVLQSASALRNERRLRGEREEEFWAAHRYLWKRTRYMNYAWCRSQGIPIGSGVTEAGCKTVVTQRLKRSGMRWSEEGGQVVMTLRCVRLSRLWGQTWEAHLAEGTRLNLGTYDASLRTGLAGAA